MRPFRRLARLRFDPWLIPVALLALIPILSVLRPGLPNTADGQVHLLRSLQVAELMRAGILYPRWAPDFYFGYGYPFFNFYAPGAHLLAGLAALGGLGVLRGVVAVQVAALLLTPVGAYLAARALFDGRSVRRTRPAALVSAALYLYAPLRFRELFVQGNLSQLLALGLLPWCAWALTRAVRSGSWRWAAVAGLVLAGLLYAHHPTAFLAFPLLGLYAVGVALIFRADAHAGPAASAKPPRGTADEKLTQRHKDHKGQASSAGQLGVLVSLCEAGACIFRAGVAFMLGLSISAAFWLPALAEMADVNISAVEAGMFNARLNLVPLTDLLSPAPVLDDAALNPPMPHSLGIAQAALAALGVLGAGMTFIRSRAATGGTFSEQAARVKREPSPVPQSALAAFLLAVLLLVSLALMLPVAAPLWEHLPLARLIAFPWRLLGPALLWAALLGASAFLAIPERFSTPALLLLLILVPLSVATYLFPRPFAPASEPVLADIARYELDGGARGTASANEYLPRWVADPDPPLSMASDYLAGRPPDRLDRAALPPGSQVQALVQAPLTDAYRLELPIETRVIIRRFYFPGWRAWVDGRPVPVAPEGKYGLIGVAVPAGAHELRLSFGTTPSRTVGGLLAWGGMIAALALAWLGPRVLNDRSVDQERKQPGVAAWKPLLASAATILLLTGAKAFVIEPHTRWFRWKSPVDAPAAMQHPIHARFSNGIELIGYDLPRGAVRQGDTLEVRLYWRPLQPQRGDVQPFLHLDAVTGDVTWANQTKLHAGDKPSSGWPPGFYVVDDYRLAIPTAAPPVVGVLRAGLLTGNGERVPLQDGGDTVPLASLRVRERQPLRVTAPPGFAGPYRLGSRIRLLSYRATVMGMPPVLELTLYWQADEPLTQDYTVFVHVLDAADHRVAQGDGPPWHGWYPTSAWAAGQVIPDVRQIPLPADVRPADLHLAVGLYTSADGARLAVTDNAGNRQPDDRIKLPLIPGQ